MKLCECGCGLPAPIATKTSDGWVKGQSKRYVHGHHLRGKKRGEAFRAKMRAVTPRGAASWKWREGKSRTGKGYILLHGLHGHPQANHRGHALEHRVVLAELIGRPLLPSEAVHHVNEIRDDNRPENLWLFPSRGAHTQWHRSCGVLKRPMASIDLPIKGA